MIHRRLTAAFLTTLLFASAGCCTTSRHASDADDDDEVEIALSDVPAHVLAAAEAALPGGHIVEAETEIEDGRTVYSLDSMRDGEEWEIDVDADGRVLEVERDEEDDDDDDEEDDD